MSHLRSARQESAITHCAEEIFRSPTSFVAGNPDGDVNVVAFFDYNCPYWRKDAPALAELILKELPVLGADSEAAARIALAAKAQGKYLELYERLINERGRATKDKALRIAPELGLDIERLEQDARSPEVADALAEDELLAGRLGIRGVPVLSRGRPAGTGRQGSFRRSCCQGRRHSSQWLPRRVLIAG